MADDKAMLGVKTSGGRSSVVKGGNGKGFKFGPEHARGTAGTKRFDVTSKSLNRGRRM